MRHLFSSLAFRDDGLVLAAGTSSGRVVFYDVRGKPQPFTVLRAYGSSEIHFLLYNFKDEMEVFSPLVDVQPITPLLDKFWDDHEGLKKGNLSVEKKPSSLLFPSSSRRFPFQKDGTNDSPIFDWKSSSTSRQNDARSFTLPGGSTPSSSSKSDDSSITPPEAWGDERLSDKTANLHQPLNLPSRFAITSGSSALGSMFSGLQDLPSSTSQTGTGSLTNSSCSFSNLHTMDVSLNQETSMGFPELISSSSMPLSSGTKGIMGLASLEASGPASLNQPRRFSTYAERISTTASFSDGASLSLRTLEETLDSFQKSIHEDMRSLHIEVLRQFHMQEMGLSGVMNSILENQAELMKELSLPGKKTELRNML
ncbi:PROTEIN NEDD1 [Salix koriyanagi]|uniref:PROTEIN NEDD1 n=1 Tax=Salix koriyanagi TaxID=2511006 RepID=A0A9Q1AIS0_9ROSI|nr:PROTEIN NEDD1 [Salix koriyanagi]